MAACHLSSEHRVVRSRMALESEGYVERPERQRILRGLIGAYRDRSLFLRLRFAASRFYPKRRDGQRRLLTPDRRRRQHVLEEQSLSDPALYRRERSLHPQWIVIDLSQVQQVDTLRIAWTDPFATEFVVQYWTGGDEPIHTPTRGGWQAFPFGTLK